MKSLAILPFTLFFTILAFGQTQGITESQGYQLINQLSALNRNLQQQQDAAIRAQMRDTANAAAKDHAAYEQNTANLDPAFKIYLDERRASILTRKPVPTEAKIYAEVLSDWNVRINDRITGTKFKATYQARADANAKQTAANTSNKTLSSEQISAYYQQLAITRYPDLLVPNSPLVKRMVSMDRYLATLGDPLVNLPEKYLTLANIAAAELGIKPIVPANSLEPSALARARAAAGLPP